MRASSAGGGTVEAMPKVTIYVPYRLQHRLDDYRSTSDRDASASGLIQAAITEYLDRRGATHPGAAFREPATRA